MLTTTLTPHAIDGPSFCLSTGELDLDQVRIDPAWALRVPADVAIRRRILPLCKINDTVIVASAAALDASTQRTLVNLLKTPFIIQLASAESVRRACSRVYEQATFDLPDNHQADNAARRHRISFTEAEQTPDAVKLCDEILQAAILRNASDIHLVPTADQLMVQLRVDGQLEIYRHFAHDVHAGVINRLKVLSGMDIAEKRAAQDGRITSHNNKAGKRLEMRVATLPTRHGERMTLRVLGTQAGDISLSNLGLCNVDLERFVSATSRPHGLILLTGPTGSGKSTTLYVAIEQLLKTRGGNVITIEDPIEYEIAGASQVEIDTADKVNFTKALRSLLRHDPDVVMIGEIRDSETANIAVKASLTGHLVFSTLHTNNAAGVVTRLIDLGVEPFLIAATLRLSMAQRLVRRLCEHCHAPRALTTAESMLLGKPELVGQTIYEPHGCVMCAGRGYSGRIGLFEMMPGNEQLAELISSGCPEQMLTSYAAGQGWASLLDDGLQKLLSGTTSLSEVTDAVMNWC